MGPRTVFCLICQKQWLCCTVAERTLDLSIKDLSSGWALPLISHRTLWQFNFSGAHCPAALRDALWPKGVVGTAYCEPGMACVESFVYGLSSVIHAAIRDVLTYMLWVEYECPSQAQVLNSWSFNPLKTMGLRRCNLAGRSESLVGLWRPHLMLFLGLVDL